MAQLTHRFVETNGIPLPETCLGNDRTLPHPIHGSNKRAQVVIPQLLNEMGMLKPNTCYHCRFLQEILLDVFIISNQIRFACTLVDIVSDNQ
jgi:hypothetical protein